MGNCNEIIAVICVLENLYPLGFENPSPRDYFVILVPVWTQQAIYSIIIFGRQPTLNFSIHDEGSKTYTLMRLGCCNWDFIRVCGFLSGVSEQYTAASASWNAMARTPPTTLFHVSILLLCFLSGVVKFGLLQRCSPCNSICGGVVNCHLLTLVMIGRELCVCSGRWFSLLCELILKVSIFDSLVGHSGATF